MSPTKEITIGDLIDSSPDRLAMELVAGREGIRLHPLATEVYKVSMPFSESDALAKPGCIRLLGRTEMSYIRSLKLKKREEQVRLLFDGEMPGCLVAGYNYAMDEVVGEMADEADRRAMPLMVSPLDTSMCTRTLIKTLEEVAAMEVTLHGVLVDVMGVGVLLLGPSGIGKSECAVELVVRGHRLVADDVVLIRKLRDGRLVGSGSELIRYHVEIRGLGILNIKDMFGISAIKARKTLDLVVELVRWEDDEPYDRLGIDDSVYDVAGVGLPFVRMPVTPGRNIAIIVEVAARNHALKMQGTNAASSLDRKLSGRLGRHTPAGQDGRE